MFCQKYQEELPAMERPPFPGPAGQALMAAVSAKAWQAWMSHQTMLINEHHLTMTDPKARKFLTEQREKFFTNAADLEQPEGYVPPEPK